MRYFLSGLGLFILLSVFVRNWYLHQRNLSNKPVITMNTSPVSLEDNIEIDPNALFSDKIILEDNLLLHTTDYETLDQLVQVMHEHNESNLTVYLAANIDTTKIENILGEILTDQGVLETRIRFLRKPIKLSNPQIAFVVQ